MLDFSKATFQNARTQFVLINNNVLFFLKHFIVVVALYGYK